MVLIGITGPTGAGKTTLLREVEALGGAVIDCDAVYHELLEHDPFLQRELERRFGPLRGENGAIDRKRLGTIVFGDPEKLALLNDVVRTVIVDRTRALVEDYRRQGRALAAIDATEDYFRSLGMPVTFGEAMGVQEEAVIRDLAVRCTFGHTRKVGVFHPLEEEGLYQVYTAANR